MVRGEKKQDAHILGWWCSDCKLYKENPTLPPWEFHPYLVQNCNDYQGGTQVRYTSDTDMVQSVSPLHTFTKVQSNQAYVDNHRTQKVPSPGFPVMPTLGFQLLNKENIQNMKKVTLCSYCKNTGSLQLQEDLLPVV